MNKNGIILGVLFIIVFVGGFLLGRFFSVSPFIGVPSTAVPSTTTGQATTDANSASAAAVGTTSTQGSQVPASSLTDGQKAMLKALGIDPNNFTITPTMVACAEAKLGAARVEEIKNGATPSFSEGVSLVACYH